MGTKGWESLLNTSTEELFAAGVSVEDAGRAQIVNADAHVSTLCRKLIGIIRDDDPDYAVRRVAVGDDGTVGVFLTRQFSEGTIWVNYPLNIDLLNGLGNPDISTKIATMI